MFDNLSTRLGKVFDRLKGKGVLSEGDVGDAMREIRVAMLEADVALPVVKDFIASVREKAVGQEVLRSITPGQMVVKIVNDHLRELLGGATSELKLASPPAVILMVGLQGSGKTTSSAKLAVRLRKDRKKVLLASLDVQRPAAQKQLEVLAQQAQVDSLPIVNGQQPLDITRRALESARREGFDVLILDTAGRLHIDESLMVELLQVRDLAKPHETLLVADALTGQDAVNVASHFHERIAVTGIVLTRLDGDARGGAALSMRQVTGRPIKFVGMGEKLDALEVFHPDRMAGRILGMGDVVSLVEKAAEIVDKDEAERLADKLQRGSFSLEDFKSQLLQVKKMGGMGGIMGKLPGIAKLKAQMGEAKIDEKIIGRQIAIIDSMTKIERRNPKIIDGSRRRRIAKGSGTDVADVNRLLKQHRQMQDMMKQMKKAGGLGNLKNLLSRGGLGGMKLPPGLMPPR
ncbi:signal recognition particle subunit FFH/SRP54 (srp54) [Arboricoccus pini]|uniref:Signal recognition particle protein n=1 Tax=Arboricoccus pini TaxID=1963835 RepID=A0A212QNL7_9PROT|nr:signal recognition particle protein [Arboricoccus pini]SNB60966.1 signal recognition particle subunit FFH/SRP54 (srp54) [Arboricoccus pini]